MKTNNKIMKWEYKKVMTTFADLNSLGGEGWELCNIEKLNGANPLSYYIFKRPKIDTLKVEYSEISLPKAQVRKSAFVDIKIGGIKVGDWVVALSKSGDIKWSKSYLVSEITEEKISVWYEKKEYSYLFKDIMDDFSKFKVAPKGFPKCQGSYNPNEKKVEVVKKIKKVNAKNQNNIRKGDWVSINVDDNCAYEVLSVKNGLLTMLYLGQPYTGWSERLETVYKVKAEDFKNKTKTKVF